MCMNNFNVVLSPIMETSPQSLQIFGVFIRISLNGSFKVSYRPRRVIYEVIDESKHENKLL